MKNTVRLLVLIFLVFMIREGTRNRSSELDEQKRRLHNAAEHAIAAAQSMTDWASHELNAMKQQIGTQEAKEIGWDK